MTKNLTTGSPLKLILQFTVPLLLGNLFQQTYNMVDAAIVGRYLGSRALAAVGASSSVQFLILGFCIGVCAGFAVPVAQRFGAGDLRSVRQFIFVAGVTTAAAAVVITAACSLLCPVILHLLRTPRNIFADAYAYLLVIFIGIPFTLLYNLLSSILRAVGDSRTPFLFLVVSASLNIVLDLLLIIVAGWGCAGAAVATVLSQAISGVLCLILIAVRFKELHPGRDERKWSFPVFRELIIMGVPMGMQFSITAIGSMVLQASNNNLGSVYVSAFTAGTKLKQLCMCPFDALATAVSTFAGQNYGAGDVKRIKKGVALGVAIGVAYGAAIGLVLIFFGRYMSMMFISAADSDVLDAAETLARRLGFFSWSLGILNVTRLCTQALGYSNRAVFSGVTEMFARCFVSFLFVPSFGYDAICFADQTAWITACLYIAPTCLYCIRRIERELKSHHTLMLSS